MPSFMRRITPSAGTAIAFTALLIALSGTAVALPGKNKVEGNDIRKNALTAKKIKANSVNRREGQGQQPDRRGHPGELAGHGAARRRAGRPAGTSRGATRAPSSAQARWELPRSPQARCDRVSSARSLSALLPVVTSQQAGAGPRLRLTYPARLCSAVDPGQGLTPLECRQRLDRLRCQRGSRCRDDHYRAYCLAP